MKQDLGALAAAKVDDIEEQKRAAEELDLQILDVIIIDDDDDEPAPGQ